MVPFISLLLTMAFVSVEDGFQARRGVGVADAVKNGMRPAQIDTLVGPDIRHTRIITTGHAVGQLYSQTTYHFSHVDVTVDCYGDEVARLGMTFSCKSRLNP